MGCAKSKLPCRESTNRGDEKLKEILTQKGLVYSPSILKDQQQSNYVYANGYNTSYHNQQFYVQANTDCQNGLSSIPYHDHYYVYRHAPDQPPPPANNNRSSTGVQASAPPQGQQQYRLQQQYGEDPSNINNYQPPPQQYRPPRQDNMFTRLSGRIRRPKSRRHGNEFDPRVTSKYDVKALIGKGSFSRVLKVEHKASRYPFAMKVMPADQGTGPFENELSILSRVDHMHVIRLIEVFRTETRVYVVMELATGGELYDRIISKGRFSEFETSTSLRMILDGLSYLHRIGITHRDLKPENILYYHPGTDSKLMITDFGLAHQSQIVVGGGDQQTTNEQQLMTDPCGTPEYIAPEILARIPYTNKVDLWAMGVITFILLSGSMPFDDENRTVLYRHILRCKYHFYPELWSDVGDEARQFVAALLCLDPLRRLSAEQALQNIWLQSSLNRIVEPPTPRRPVHKSHSAQDDTGRRRSRSTRSIRSVARSDAGRRVNRAEVERLHQDPEIRRILFEASRNHQQLQQQQQQPQQPQKEQRSSSPQQAPKYHHPINGVVITATSPHPANGRTNAVSTTLITTTNYGML